MKRVHPPLLWASKCGRYKVAITRKAYSQMLKLALVHYPNEIGTSLVGTYSKDGFQASICGLTPLTTDSKSSGTWFVRGVRGLNKFYKQLLDRFNGQRHYVGEWHSHPDASPASSGIDQHTHNSIANDHAANCPEVVLAVLGGDLHSEPELQVSVCSLRRGEVRLFPVPSF